MKPSFNPKPIISVTPHRRSGFLTPTGKHADLWRSHPLIIHFLKLSTFRNHIPGGEVQMLFVTALRSLSPISRKHRDYKYCHLLTSALDGGKHPCVARTAPIYICRPGPVMNNHPPPLHSQSVPVPPTTYMLSRAALGEEG